MLNLKGVQDDVKELLLNFDNMGVDFPINSILAKMNDSSEKYKIFNALLEICFALYANPWFNYIDYLNQVFELDIIFPESISCDKSLKEITFLFFDNIEMEVQ